MPKKEKSISVVPKTHPRYQSLSFRHKIIEGMNNYIVAEAGLIAHGRGECFDYILGEQTTPPAKKAIRAAVAALLIAKNPIISVNGNVAALVSKEIVKLAKIISIPLEINLFYRKKGRIKAIEKELNKAGATDILGIRKDEMVELTGLESNRRNVSVNGILKADLVMVPLEDGDRTETLKKIKKNVIAIDLNPISRTSLWADITIVDNIIRVIPEMIKVAQELKYKNKNELKTITANFDNKKNIQEVLDLIIKYIESQKEKAFEILNSNS